MKEYKEDPPAYLWLLIRDKIRGIQYRNRIIPAGLLLLIGFIAGILTGILFSSRFLHTPASKSQPNINAATSTQPTLQTTLNNQNLHKPHRKKTKSIIAGINHTSPALVNTQAEHFRYISDSSENHIIVDLPKVNRLATTEQGLHTTPASPLFLNPELPAYKTSITFQNIETTGSQEKHTSLSRTNPPINVGLFFMGKGYGVWAPANVLFEKHGGVNSISGYSMGGGVELSFYPTERLNVGLGVGAGLSRWIISGNKDKGLITASLFPFLRYMLVSRGRTSHWLYSNIGYEDGRSQGIRRSLYYLSAGIEMTTTNGNHSIRRYLFGIYAGKGILSGLRGTGRTMEVGVYILVGAGTSLINH